jgi:hypothetical protein
MAKIGSLGGIGMVVIGLTRAFAAPVGTSAGSDLIVRAPNRSTTLRMTPDQLTGPQVALGRDGTTWRGQVRGRPIELRTTEDEVVGTFAAPINLRARPDGAGIRITGTFAGGRCDLRVSPERILGRVGGGYFALDFVDGEYRGMIDGVSHMSLQLPAVLATLSPGSAAAILTVVLGIP